MLGMINASGTCQIDRALQERGVFSIGRTDREAIIRRVVSDTTAEILTAPLNVEMIEREPRSR